MDDGRLPLLPPVSCRVILDLCGGTGSWSAPYRDAGYDVRIIDPRADGGDVRLWPSKPSTLPRLPREFDDIRGWIGRVHGVLAAPVCTFLAGSGARWPRSDEAVLAGLAVADACFRIIHVIRPRWWALENPVGKLARWHGPPRMRFHPCDYGDPYTKRTCLWGDFTIPARQPVEATEGSRMWRLPPSPERQYLRSVTPPGFARAFFNANP